MSVLFWLLLSFNPPAWGDYSEKNCAKPYDLNEVQETLSLISTNSTNPDRKDIADALRFYILSGNMKGSLLLICDDTGKISSISTHRSKELKYVYISYLVSVPGTKGAGKAAIQELLQICSEKGLEKLSLVPIASEPGFFEHLGFRSVEEGFGLELTCPARVSDLSRNE